MYACQFLLCSVRPLGKVCFPAAHSFGCQVYATDSGCPPKRPSTVTSLPITLQQRVAPPIRIKPKHSTHPLLEDGQVGLGEGVSLGNDGDEVDPGSETLHDLNVEGLEGVTGRTDEVQASMNAEVGLFTALRLLFLAHVNLVLVIDEIDDRCPAVAVVDIVAETGSVDDRQLDLELLLFQLGLDDVDLNSLVELLGVSPGVVLARRKLGAEERVDHCVQANMRE